MKQKDIIRKIEFEKKDIENIEIFFKDGKLDYDFFKPTNIYYFYDGSCRANCR